MHRDDIQGLHVQGASASSSAPDQARPVSAGSLITWRVWGWPGFRKTSRAPVKRTSSTDRQVETHRLVPDTDHLGSIVALDAHDRRVVRKDVDAHGSSLDRSPCPPLIASR